ncbi:uncharacterized protein CBL_07603 [Carabus blaptoides fortunei]
MTHNPDGVITRAIGEFGRWQLLMIIAIFASKFAVGWHQILVVIVSPPVEFACSNATLDKCSVDCPSHDFDRNIFTETIITEWDLVCDKLWLASFTQTIVMLGILIGNYAFGALADRFGRRGPLIAAIFMQVVTGIGAAFAPWLWLYMVLRCLSTIATGGTMLTGFILLMEFTAMKYRTVVGVLFQLPFHLGHASLGLIGYLLRDWHHMQMAVSLPQILLLSYFCILPESPRWLMALGRVDQVVKTLEGAAKCNKLPTENIRHEVESYMSRTWSDEQKSTAFDLVRTKRMRVKTLCLSLNWFVIALEYFAMAQYIGQIGGNIFLNIGAAGLFQVPGNFLLIWLMNRFGRKASLIFSYVVCFVPCFIIAFLPSEPTWPTTMMGCIGMMGISMSFSNIYIYSTEMYPTVVRNSGMGLSSMIARIGSMISPFITQLQEFRPWIPAVVLGTFPVISSLVTLIFLPETLNVHMPDNIEEADSL